MDLAEIASALRGRVSGKTPIGGTLKFDLGSDGSLFVDGTGPGNTVAASKNDPANCTVRMNAQDLKDLLDGRLQPAAAFMQGRMRIDGDMVLAMKLGQLV